MNVQHVPNHERKAFRDMTPEERSAIVEALIDGRLEVNQGDEWLGDVAAIHTVFAYRTRPRQLVIPWEHIKEEYKWAVMNEDEGLWVYVEKPEIYNEEMWNIRGKCSPLPLNIDTTGIDWRESLTARPEGV